MFSVEQDPVLVDRNIMRIFCLARRLLWNQYNNRVLVNVVFFGRYFTCKKSDSLDESVTMMIFYPCIYKTQYDKEHCDVVDV